MSEDRPACEVLYIRQLLDQNKSLTDNLDIALKLLAKTNRSLSSWTASMWDIPYPNASAINATITASPLFTKIMEQQ